jgi:hypothetical protein
VLDLPRKGARAFLRVLCTVSSITLLSANGNLANNPYTLSVTANTTLPIPTYTLAPDPTGCTLNVEIQCDPACPSVLPITNFIWNLHNTASYYVNACDNRLNTLAYKYWFKVWVTGFESVINTS